MTSPNPPIVPEEPYQLGDVLPAQPKRSRAPWIIAGVAVLLALGGVAAAVVALGQDDAKPAASATPSAACERYSVDASTGAVVCGNAAAPAVVNEGPDYATPTPADFKVTVKILERECFGSAGCNLSYRIDPQYSGAPLDPSVTWLVTYEVHGVEDGPIINTFEVTGDQASFDSEENAGVKTSKSKLTVKVTDVTQN